MPRLGALSLPHSIFQNLGLFYVLFTRISAHACVVGRSGFCLSSVVGWRFCENGAEICIEIK